MFTLPDSLAGLDRAALDELVNAGIEAYGALGLSEASDEDTVAEAERIVGLVRQVRAEIESRAATAATVAAFDAEMTVPDPEPEPEPAAEPEPDPDAAPADPPQPEAAEPPPAAVVAEPAPVAAAAEPHTAVVARRGPAPTLPKEKHVSLVLTAAADVPGFATGSKMEHGIESLSAAIISRMKAFPTARTNVQVFNRYGTAIIEPLRTDGLTQENPDYRDDQALIDAAGREARLKGGSLVAAGGWCAPSETLYDLCEGETTDGIIDVPEITVTRGGIRYTTGPDFSTIYGMSGYFTQTEAQAIAGTPKTCMEVPCPAFTDVRLDAVGVCIKAPILTNAGYPELVRRFISGALIAQQHKVSAAVIAKMKTAAGAAVAPVSQGSTSTTSEALAWVAESMRQKYRLGDNATLEVVLPHWFRQSLREDFNKRSGRTDISVSDAEIAAWFSDRHLAPQFVYGLSDLTPIAAKPPATADALIYPAGTFVKGTSPVINLDSVYDSTDLATNLYTALFAEEGVLVAQRCNQASLVTIPVCDSGRAGINDLNQCMGTVQT